MVLRREGLDQWSSIAAIDVACLDRLGSCTVVEAPDLSRRRPDRTSAWLALALLAPVPTIGVTSALVVAPGPIGQAVFTACKLWLLLLPTVWYLAVERGRPSWSPPRRGGLGVGLALGAAIGATILLAYTLAVSDRVDPSLVRQAARTMTLLSPPDYLLAAAGWTLVNSLMEEYVYRWFVLRQLRAITSDLVAIFGSALVFTAHHVVAVSVYLTPALTVLASLGVFLGGVTWSWLYLRYRSVWPPWISHVLADVAVFVIGWHLLFG
jgi:membrane protease YdiL (CAAX protease family)